MYINKLANIVNDTYHSVIKMNPIDTNSSTYIDFGTEIMKKILNLKLIIIYEYQTIKAFLEKFTHHVCLMKLL